MLDRDQSQTKVWCENSRLEVIADGKNLIERTPRLTWGMGKSVWLEWSGEWRWWPCRVYRAGWCSALWPIKLRSLDFIPSVSNRGKSNRLMTTDLQVSCYLTSSFPVPHQGTYHSISWLFISWPNMKYKVLAFLYCSSLYPQWPRHSLNCDSFIVICCFLKVWEVRLGWWGQGKVQKESSQGTVINVI